MALVQHDGSSDFLPRPQPSRQTVDEIMAMDGDVFKDLVDRDIRTSEDEVLVEPEYADALRSADVCERWFQMLVRLKKSTELTIAAKRDDDKLSRIRLLAGGNTRKADTERVHFLRWRAGAVRFLTGVEIRLTEANYWRRVHFGSGLPSQIVDERNHMSVSVQILRRAIHNHRADFLSHDSEEPSDGDRALWAILDDINTAG